jgi:hypothetical protein
MKHLYPPNEHHEELGSCPCWPTLERDYIIHTGQTAVGHYTMQLALLLVRGNYDIAYLPSLGRWWCWNAPLMVNLRDPDYPVVLTTFPSTPPDLIEALHANNLY